ARRLAARPQQHQRCAHGKHQRRRQREERKVRPARRRRGRGLGETPILPQASGDLQPHAIGPLQVVHRSRRIMNAAQIGEPRVAVLALVQVHLELRTADRAERAVDHLLDLREVASASHEQLPVTSYQLPASSYQLPATSNFPVPSRRFCWGLATGYHFLASNARSLNRALCTCDFDVPSAIPNTSATSRCSSPSTSCSTKAARHPSGSCASARSRSIRAIARSPSRCSRASASTVACSSPSVICPARAARLRP